MITACPSVGPAWYLADWLELEVLCRGSDGVPVHAINQDSAIEADVEPEAFDEDSVDADDRIARMTNEIATRVSCMKGSYPFRLSADGGRLLRVPCEEIGGTVYLFCLLAQHIRRNGFLRDAGIVQEAAVPNLFQACAVWCAAGAQRGHSYSIGAPRHDHSPFLVKLAQIYRHLGNGVPVATIPAGAPPKVQDDGIDVIAWEWMPDDRVPADYMLAQVASGQNWPNKSVIAPIEVFHATWFEKTPTTKTKPALVVPFCVDGDVEDGEEPSQEALAMQWTRLLAGFGEVFYRYRVPVFAQMGQGMHAQGATVELTAWQEHVTKFVDDAVIALRGYVAA